MSSQPPSSRSSAAAAYESPSAPLAALDQLWFQVSGTVCNLRCSHCFISCAPDNHSFWFMSRQQVRQHLDDSVGLGVKEYYFTGGEPFMTRHMLGILEDTLELGPATVLTNGTLLPIRTVTALAKLAAATPYSLELRVSLDGATASSNDAIRGAGSFRRTLEGIERLVAAGFLPIITAMQSWDDAAGDAILVGFRELLASVGYERPRLKILPPLRIGAEAKRSRGYEPTERVTHEMLHGFDLDQLLCSRARLVSARGVHACPILLDAPVAFLGRTLHEAVRRPALLVEQACYTCYVNGAICSNAPSPGGSPH